MNSGPAVAGVSNAASWLAFLLYAASLACYCASVLARSMRYEKLGRMVLGAGILAHAAAFVLDGLRLGTLPVTNLRQSLSFLSLLAASGFLTAGWRPGMAAAALPAVGFSGAAILGSLLIPLNWTDMAVPQTLRSGWFPAHVAASFIGEASFACAFAAYVVYLVQERAIKNKVSWAILDRLPPLGVLDAVAYKCVVIGVTFLTVGIVTGAFWAKEAWGEYWSWDIKQTWSLVCWLLFAAVLHARLVAGWRGRRAAMMTIAGFLITVGTLVSIFAFRLGRHVGDFR